MLNWNFTNKQKFAELSDDEKALTDCFIWGCMIVGLGEITEKNAEEWAWRYSFADKLNGTLFWRVISHGKDTKQVPYIPTIAEVKKRIGLRTNCFPNKTRNKFVLTQAKNYKPSL